MNPTANHHQKHDGQVAPADGFHLHAEDPNVLSPSAEDVPPWASISATLEATVANPKPAPTIPKYQLQACDKEGSLETQCAYNPSYLLLQVPQNSLHVVVLEQGRRLCNHPQAGIWGKLIGPLEMIPRMEGQPPIFRRQRRKASSSIFN